LAAFIDPGRWMISIAEKIPTPRSERHQQHPVVWRGLAAMAALFLAGAMLSLPAIWNRSPLLFYDTGGYLLRASGATSVLLHEHSPALPRAGQAAGSEDAKGVPSESEYKKISRNPFFLRPIAYSIFLIPFSGALSFFLLPLAQGILSAYVIRRLLTTLDVYSWKTFFFCIGTLGVLSSLPLYVSQMMPDLFTSLMIVMSFVAVYSWPTRSVRGRVFDTCLVALTVAVHLSHVPIMLALVVIYGLAAVLFRKDVKPAAVATGAVAPLLLAITLAVSSNAIVARHPVMSESSPLFMLARLLGDGPARAYLNESCPAAGYQLCNELDHLGDHTATASVSDYFLWDPNGIVKRTANPGLLREAAEIDRATIKRYPLWVAGNAIRNGLTQLITFQVDPKINLSPRFLIADLHKIDARLATAFVQSRQAKRQFPVAEASRLLVFGLVVSLAAGGYLALRARRSISSRAFQFVAVVFVSLGANALATGALSQIHERYQNRVIWLLVLCALVLASSALQARRSPTVAE
jgi:hypothetical protein